MRIWRENRLEGTWQRKSKPGPDNKRPGCPHLKNWSFILTKWKELDMLGF